MQFYSFVDKYIYQCRVRVMVFNATFNNISVLIGAVSFIGGGNRSI